MKSIKVILILTILSLASCSHKPDNEDAVGQGDLSVESTESAAATDTDLVVDDNDKEKKADEVQELMADEPKVEEKSIIEAEEPKSVVSNEPKRELQIQEQTFEKAALSGEMGTYKVEKGETLMMIAFKIYGDYSMWRELSRLNPKIKGNVTPGLTLKFKAPVEKFVWNPAGEPYLIKKGDTLGVISNEKYGTPKKWKKIWDNNKPLIKNPNLIFAGFTLYYIPDNKLADVE